MWPNLVLFLYSNRINVTDPENNYKLVAVVEILNLSGYSALQRGAILGIKLV